ncbi:MAG: A/G-specific adenine glycosylase [Acidimicrobiia bacterium]|nr:A/G-specific adenine glycosylase [Acidimicrobiia bacterium]MDH5237526.1 A/G-specific adenine glycosylase [Acidimicrobiia bacterium]
MGRVLTVDTADVDRDAVLAWGRSTRRDLPWRRTRDPWAVLVSELMLQQTQVSRVVPRYEVFLRRFPTATACAAAGQAEVVRLWDGLGYNRRARHLHQAAATICDRHRGEVPERLEDLLALPGVGPYTARAVLVFAFERDVGAVDTNVARLLARWQGRTLSRHEVQAAADATVPPGQAWEWTQALFDLGATVCTKRSPSCGRCPVRPDCAWAGVGADPAKGSAGVGGSQSRFDGSDRQGRGRLIAALRRGPVASADLAATAGWTDDDARAARVMAALVHEGLVVPDGDVYRLG